MQIPPDAVLPAEKLTRYLLVARPEDDKSRFLSQAGFYLDNFRELELAIRELASELPAIEDEKKHMANFIGSMAP